MTLYTVYLTAADMVAMATIWNLFTIFTQRLSILAVTISSVICREQHQTQEREFLKNKLFQGPSRSLRKQLQLKIRRLGVSQLRDPLMVACRYFHILFFVFRTYFAAGICDDEMQCSQGQRRTHWTQVLCKHRHLRATFIDSSPHQAFQNQNSLRSFFLMQFG